MAFVISSKVEGMVATINLEGDLDSLSARVFQTEIVKIAESKPNTLVLDMEKLVFMASAGLRVLVFSKQKLGTGLTIYIVKPNELIVDTLEKTGMQHSVIIVDKYPV